MNKRWKATPRFLIWMSIIFALQVISLSIIVIYTPHAFVRIVNLIAIIIVSSVVGGLVRELFVLKQK